MDTVLNQCAISTYLGINVVCAWNVTKFCVYGETTFWQSRFLFILRVFLKNGLFCSDFTLDVSFDLTISFHLIPFNVIVEIERTMPISLFSKRKRHLNFNLSNKNTFKIHTNQFRTNRMVFQKNSIMSRLSLKHQVKVTPFRKSS